MEVQKEVSSQSAEAQFRVVVSDVSLDSDAPLSLDQIQELPSLIPFAVSPVLSPIPSPATSSIPSPIAQQTQFKRIQSPSSINTHRQCPRKYYYQYVEKLPTRPSIHLVRGKLAHSVLEDFFKIDVSLITMENYSFLMKLMINELFKKHWNNSLPELESLQLSQEDFLFYYNETNEMVNDWCDLFLQKLNQEIQQFSLHEAYNRLKPMTELQYSSQTLGVRGFVDAIFRIGDDVKIMDYKTSKKDKITEDYKLQLAIYALLYKETHGIMPKIVGIDFLKHGERFLEVDEQLLDFAKKECALIHIRTQSDNVKEYPKKITSLCKWSTGQCDFYGTCVKSD